MVTLVRIADAWGLNEKTILKGLPLNPSKYGRRLELLEQAYMTLNLAKTKQYWKTV